MKLTMFFLKEYKYMLEWLYALDLNLFFFL